MTASFKQLADYQIAMERKIDARFDKVEARLDKIETSMATKEDIATLEGRILDAFKQLVTMIDSRLLPQER